ncbi:probable flap endonuclease 1 homolog [Chanos chanos]|uniref:Probable flap endonuclease 1 homolog n=1 Tax=Chanos chanos TaxID=29144 RepID=A0A6J2VDN3_CHACN|nr:probable flap endonuclease 1 homolog [Chanos chanos]
MGITKLADLIRSDAQDSISYKEIEDYTGKVIALDTSIVMNQFRTAVPNLKYLSPLTGLFFRTLTFLEHDIKPVFVFDGKPPKQKKAVLEKRAQNAGWTSPQRSSTMSQRTQDCIRLLELIGVPCIKAPGDGEALCAHLVKSGVVDAVASEDMDTLAFGGTILLRQLNAKRDSEVTEYSLPKLLEALQLTHKEFVDLCILLGCDYCDKICGLGPRRALKLIQEHRTIEEVVLNVNRKTHPIPLEWRYQEARRLFLDTPQVDRPVLTWQELDEEGLVRFLCHEKHVKEQRVRGRIEKFRSSLQDRRRQREEDKKVGRVKQTRLEQFFRVTRKRQAQSAAQEKKFDLLSDLGGDIFAAPPSQTAGSSNFANFAHFNRPTAQSNSNTDFANFDSFGNSSVPSTHFGTTHPSQSIPQPLHTGGGVTVPSLSSMAPAPTQSSKTGEDRYAALAELDSVLSSTAPTGSTQQGNVFGAVSGPTAAQTQPGLSSIQQGFAAAPSTNPFVAAGMAPEPMSTNPFQTNSRASATEMSDCLRVLWFPFVDNPALFGTGSMSMPAGFGNPTSYCMPTSFSGTFQQPFPGQSPFPPPAAYPQQPNGTGFPAYGQAKPPMTSYGQAIPGPGMSNNPFMGGAPSGPYPTGGSSTNPFL